MKILVADDSTAMRLIIRKALTDIGLEDIIEATNGEEVIKILSDGGIGIILLDWNMPKMDGLECLKAIREENSEIPIIMVTTHSHRDRVIEARRAGANDYIIKPFTTDLLKMKLASYVEFKQDDE